MHRVEKISMQINGIAKMEQNSVNSMSANIYTIEKRED